MGDLCLLVLVCGFAGVRQDSAMVVDEIKRFLEKDMRGQALLMEPDVPPLQRRNYEKAGVVSVARLSHKVPKEAQNAFDRAVKFTKKQQYAAAITELETAIALDPQFASAFNNLGVRYFFAQRLQDAERVLRRAVALDPAFSAAYNNLGALAFSQGNLAEAEQMARSALAFSPQNQDAQSLLRETLRRAR